MRLKDLTYLLLALSSSSIAVEKGEPFSNEANNNNASISAITEAFLTSETALRTTYHQLAQAIPPALARGLARTQTDWRNHRKLACSVPTNSLDRIDCYTQANRERIAYLNDRLKECNAGKCQPHALTRQSWYTY